MAVIIASFLSALGAGLFIVAGVGVLRLPDVYSRMHAASKASSLGIGLILLGTTISFGSYGVAIKCGLIVFFVFLTTPIAAHILSRAAYLSGSAKWERTKIDELEAMYRMIKDGKPIRATDGRGPHPMV